VILSNIAELEAPATTDPKGTTTGCHGDVADSVESRRAIKIYHHDNIADDTIPYLNTLSRMRHDTVRCGKGTGRIL